MKNGGFFGTPQDEELDAESNMANGGFSGYKPNTAKHRAMRETMQQTAVNDVPQMDPMMTGMNWEQPQQATGYQATGFQQAMGYQPTGYQQPMGNFTAQQPMTGYQPTGYQQPMNAWQEQPFMDPMMATGYQAPQQSFGNTVPFPPVQQATQYQPHQNAHAIDDLARMEVCAKAHQLHVEASLAGVGHHPFGGTARDVEG